MNNYKPYELNEKMMNKIISVAYGDATLKDKFMVKRAAGRNPEIQAALDSYRHTAEEVGALSEEEFSNDLVKSVLRKNILSTKNNSTFLFDLYYTFFSRPIISVVTTIVLITAITVTLIVNKPVQVNYRYSPTEINNAELQARKAFDIVGKFFKQTKSTLEKEIMGERVAKPINKGIGIVNNLFEGDTK